MIVNRGPEPLILMSDQVNLAIDKMQEFYYSMDRGQKRYDFPFNEGIDGALKSIMADRFGRKCWYCEVGIESSELGIVDRFRPYSGIRDKDNYLPDLYWWLTFQWNNLIYCCKECAEYKANYFPIRGNRAVKPGDDLDEENAFLLDPCKTDLTLHFNYHNDGTISGHSAFGEQMVSLLRLNRTSHVEKRRNSYFEIRDNTQEIYIGGLFIESKGIIDALRQIYYGELSVEFLSYKQWALGRQLSKLDKLGVVLGIDAKPVKNPFVVTERSVQSEVSYQEFLTNDFFPIEYIHIRNFKGISDLLINFKENAIQKKSWLFLLGENGVGKSSILQALAIGIGADINLLKPMVPSLIQKGKAKAEITVKEWNSNNEITTVLRRRDNSIIQTGVFNSFLIGYGSLRLSIEETGEGTRLDKDRISYENLFHPIKPLNDITQWLVDIHKKRPDFFDAIAYSIKQLLPHDFKDNELTVEEGQIVFRNSEKSFAELSDGFKSTIILAVDIMMKLSSAHADMDKMTGIVLIDELGNQLHPRWQMRIVKQLRTVFKNLNFIVSTHHPLCLRGSERDEILLLKNMDGAVVPVTELPDPVSLRVDQLLASEFFGLSSLLDPELEAKFNRYYALLAREGSLDLSERGELTRLKDELRSQKQLGASLREELMYHAIDTLLASKLIYNKAPLNREQLKKEVVQRVEAIWKQFNVDGDDQP